MALFKVKVGPSSALDNQKAKEGQVFFTPDDGFLYIDIAGNGTTTPVKATSTTENANANRIKVAGLAALLSKTLTINGKTYPSTSNVDVGTILTQYGGTGNTSFTANRLVYTESATKLSSCGAAYANSDGVALGQTSLDTNYIFVVNGKSKFKASVELTQSLAVEGAATFSDQIEVEKTTDSTSKTDSAASIITSGGVSIAKTASVQQLRVNDAVRLHYDTNTSCLQFIFD